MRPAVVAMALLAAAPCFALAPACAAEPIHIVAAENFYGYLAAQIGGDHVAVASILANPDDDPHLFESSASTARDIDQAQIVIYNGADYDPWMDRLLSASTRPARTVLIAASLIGKASGDNPHLWYDPRTFPALAAALAADLEKRDPADAGDFRANLEKFSASLAPIGAKIAAIRAAHGGVAVTATEPVFGYMAEALGFKMLNYSFQLATMNDAEPSPSDVVAFERSLKDGTAKILFYNSQVTDDTTTRLLNIAKYNKVKIIGVTETEPKGKTIAAWFVSQLSEVEDALK